MMTFSFASLGCKVNQYEVRNAAAELSAAGFKNVPFGSPADICIINTCCVTSESGAKSRKTISRARRENPGTFLVITGCYSEIEKDSVEKMFSPCLVVSNADKDSLAEKVIEQLRKNDKYDDISVPLCGRSIFAEERTRYTVKIQDGCDSFCSYCIIPYARGRIRSRSPEDIISELKDAASRGFREVVLTGIHLTKFGSDSGGEYGLARLCRDVSEIEGIDRIRLSSLEPGYFNRENIAVLKECGEKLCPHFHLSLQSGSDEILRLMNRKYTSREYLEEISSLRDSFPGAAITTDIMVGFPGETDELFEESLSTVRKAAFSRMHVFSYSSRPGTAAAKMEQIPSRIKKERSVIMLRTAAELERRFHENSRGTVHNVLFEEKKDGLWRGYSENYIDIRVCSSENLHNTVRKTEIKDACDTYCTGVLV